MDQAEDEDSEDEDYEEDGGPVGSASGRKKKVGAKKQAKLDAKQQKKQQMAALEQMREERKRQERAKEQERLDKEAEEEKVRKMEEEEDERRRQAIEKKQQDEYNEWKSMFAVEESGVEAIDEAERAQQTLEMIDFCKTNKVVLLEDLVSAYKLKTPQLLELLAELDADGRLTGVVDDRGKFFHISEEEYSQVTKFIERRGRISMEDLTTEWFVSSLLLFVLFCFVSLTLLQTTHHNTSNRIVQIPV